MALYVTSHALPRGSMLAHDRGVHAGVSPCLCAGESVMWSYCANEHILLALEYGQYATKKMAI